MNCEAAHDGARPPCYARLMPDFPTKEELLDWIRENPEVAGKREIARAFGIKGADRVELKRLLRELQDDGHVERRRRSLRPAGQLPHVSVLKITHTDRDGDLFAEPVKWEAEGPPPRVLVLPRRSDPALGQGDRVLAKIRPVRTDTHAYEARPIKKIADAARRMLGIFRAGPNAGRMVPVEKRGMKEWIIPRGETNGARDGELIEAESIDDARLGLPRARVVARHGDPGAPRQVSLIAMVQHQIPYDFPDDVLAEAEAAQPVDLDRREDLRDLALITIDPADARDHDDAICAMPDPDPANPDGHIVWVAIADVAHYVRPGSALDREARERGNSTYFPDRVSPMLPETLSADLCSLMPGVDRPCMAVRMVLDAQGNKLGHRFTRGLMRSPAALAYPDVQAAVDGAPQAQTGIAAETVRDVLTPLYAAYRAAASARERRQPLELDLPERRIELDEDGQVRAIAYRERLDAHRVVEDFMILANVAAAETLETHRAHLLYRVHEEPNPEKLDALRETVESIGLSLAKGQVLKTRHLNQLLASARGTESAETISMSVLRAQTQAYYAPYNYGHFGLNLPRYAHFTSPIRRYSDLIVHRALIGALRLGQDGLSRDQIDRLAETAEHISQTERRSMEAERDTVDRYVAAYLADREGGEFTGRIAGVSKAGAFVKLDETGADGLVPISSLGTDYFHLDRDAQCLTGERTGRVIGLGMRATVRLVEATPVTGGLILELLSVEGTGLGRQARGRTGAKGARRKIDRAKLKKRASARRGRRGG